MEKPTTPRPGPTPLHDARMRDAQREPTKLELKIGQLYQILGDRLMGDPSPASDAEIQRALDYAADTERFDPDFLPWPDPDRAEFEVWFAKLEAAAIRRGWPADYIKGTGKGCWRDYFLEGDSPDAALNMDASYGEPG